LLLSKFQCRTSREDEPTASRTSHRLHAWAFEGGYTLENNNDILSETEGRGKAGGKEEIIGLHLLLPLP